MTEHRDKTLIDDIRPIPVKERSALGKVILTLEGGQEVTLVGVIYGIEHALSGEDYTARVFLDHYNQRIRILDYTGPNYDGIVMALRKLAEANGLDKIICYARRTDWQRFLRHGYVLEAVLKHYFRGEDAYIVSKFRSQVRLSSPNLMEEILLIETIMSSDRKAPSRALPEGYAIRVAQKEDIPELIGLYQSIFETYPSPLIYEDYLKTVFEKESLFAVVTKGDDIVAAASAELHPVERAAELTDCATLPSERGKGLMSLILMFLEQKLSKRGYVCAYTLARGRSFGMNQVFYHLDYEFLGRLVNNCDIYGAYEDMNLWVKNLSENRGQEAR